MGQVPPFSPNSARVPSSSSGFSSFLIIGSGRVARHFAEWLRLEGLPFATWSRASDPAEDVRARAAGASHVLLAISDRAIEPFLREHEEALRGKRVTHFSGALATPLAPSAHPLMTFGESLYALDVYRSIWFGVERGSSLGELLPGLRNPSFALASEDKALYHAWCAMSGNFTAMLWSAFFERLESRFDVPRAAAFPYMRQQIANLEAQGARALTGPLARGDRETVDKHLAALEGDPFRAVYEGFASAFQSKGQPDGQPKGQPKGQRR